MMNWKQGLTLCSGSTTKSDYFETGAVLINIELEAEFDHLYGED